MEGPDALNVDTHAFGDVSRIMDAQHDDNERINEYGDTFHALGLRGDEGDVEPNDDDGDDGVVGGGDEAPTLSQNHFGTSSSHNDAYGGHGCTADRDPLQPSFPSDTDSLPLYSVRNSFLFSFLSSWF